MDNTFETKRKWEAILDFTSLFLLFMVGSVLGFILEGIWHRIKLGIWESHSAVVWGPFCIIYGIGAAAVYLLSCCLWKKSMFLQFLAFSFSGAAVEYFSGLLQELCFGSISWDYSRHVLNIAGRVSLQMALFWGILGILFIRYIFPCLSRLFDKLHGKSIKTPCFVLAVFMVVNIIVSAAAVLRWRERQSNIPVSNQIEVFLDEHYNDDTMKKIYPNMQFQ